MKLIVALIPLALLAVTEGVTVYPIDGKTCVLRQLYLT